MSRKQFPLYSAILIGMLAGDVGFLLHVLDGSDDLPLLHVVAFVDIEVSDAAHGIGADIDIGFGADLAGGADDGNEVFAGDGSDEDLGIPGLSPNDGEPHNRGKNHNGGDNDQDLFQDISSFARVTQYPRWQFPGFRQT